MGLNTIASYTCEICHGNNCERCTPTVCCICNKVIISHKLKHIDGKAVPKCKECIL